MKKKVGFPLNVKDGWPPYDVEHIWVECVKSGHFRILNFPFFVEGIAFEDIICAKLDDNDYVLSWDIFKPSDNSTLWIMQYENTDIEQRLSDLGCGVEGDAAHHIISINVPQSTKLDELNRILEPYEKRNKIAVAVPADRIGLR